MYKRASTTSTRLFLKKIDGLAFLPPSLVVEGWDILMTENPHPTNRKLQDFISYKDNWYLGRDSAVAEKAGSREPQSLA